MEGWLMAWGVVLGSGFLFGILGHFLRNVLKLGN